MPHKLTYFDIPGLAEPIRILFSYGNLPFEDVRVSHDQTSTEWPTLKPKTPFGQLPLLELDGKLANQSIAIARYVAKQVKLAGKTDWEDLEIDAVVDSIGDLKQKLTALFHEKDEAKKSALKETTLKETVPFYMDRFSAGVKNDALVLGRLTWADVIFACYIKFFGERLELDLLAGHPKLQALQKKVFAVPTIKAWIDKQPADKHTKK